MPPSPAIVAFDLETHLMTRGAMVPRVVCLSWASGDRSGLVVGLDKIGRWMDGHLRAAARGEFLLVGHEVAFDMLCILGGFPELWDLVWKVYEKNGVTCTSIRERLIDISIGQFHSWIDGEGDAHKSDYSLQALAEKRLKKRIEKGEDTWRLRYADLESVPVDAWPTAARAYAIQDAEVTLQVYLRQAEHLSRINYTAPTEFDEVRAAFALRLMTAWGIEVDVPRAIGIWNDTARRMDTLSRDIIEAGYMRGGRTVGELFGTTANVLPLPKVKKNQTAIRAAIKQHYPGGKPPLTEKKYISTAAEVIEACDWAPLKKLVKFSALQKTASTYLGKMFESPVHARYWAIGAASDRTSCSGPNLQNQPRLPGVRECFVPRAGRVFLACDFDSQEMRTLAQSCLDIVGKSRLAERYQADRHYDPHSDLARRIAGSDTFEKRVRQESKIANFGFAGGMAAGTLVDYAKGWGVEITAKGAEKLRDLWFQQWPEMRTYFDHVQGVVGDAGWGVITIPQSGFKRAGPGYTDAANTYFQTLAAHASKRALWNVSARCYADRGSMLYGSRPVLFIHDEIILETPEDAGHEAAQEIEKVMVDAMERYTPNVPSAASATLMTRWSKKAERVLDSRGKLIPWREKE